jgi:quercetin dioxygenase-like cupin family protein
MKILPKSEPSPGPEERFTGSVDITPLKSAEVNSRLTMLSVHFSPGARSAWHTHPHGQTLYVTDGEGVIQKRGEPVQHIRPGDVIWTEPGEEHWHGATKSNDMTHLAIQEADENGNFAEWHEHVTDEEYGNRPTNY